MIALFLSLAAASLTAQPMPASDVPAPAASAVSAPATGAPQREVRYCEKGTLTGSRIPRTVCKTKTEWLKQGVDPTAK